jgi:endonuclease/exonuclease/phosphatase family metal-dependent hydrolase
MKILTAWRLGKKLPTFPDINPRVQFDHILCTRQLSIANESTTKMAVGDHLLLQADIKQ